MLINRRLPTMREPALSTMDYRLRGRKRDQPWLPMMMEPTQLTMREQAKSTMDYRR
jgi:hypothetical protein